MAKVPSKPNLLQVNVRNDLSLLPGCAVRWCRCLGRVVPRAKVSGCMAQRSWLRDCGSIPDDQRLFTPSANVRRWSLPVWQPTLTILPFYGDVLQLSAQYSSLPQSAKEHLSRLSKRGVPALRAIFGAPPWTHTEPLLAGLREMKLCSIDVRFKLKLVIHTYRCTHALASSLLCQQYKLRSHSNSTNSTTRSQLTLSLCIPSAARRPGTICPLFTSTLLWNSLPSPIRSASSLHTFRQELQKYLGIPVIRPR